MKEVQFKKLMILYGIYLMKKKKTETKVKAFKEYAKEFLEILRKTQEYLGILRKP